MSTSINTPVFIKIGSNGDIYEISRPGFMADQPNDTIKVPDDHPDFLSINVLTHYVNDQGEIVQYSNEVKNKRTTFPGPGWAWHAREGRWIDNRPLADRIESQLRVVDAERERRNLLPIQYANALFDADETAQRNVSAWMTNIASGMTVPTGFTWRDYNNVDHSADNAFVVGLGSSITVRGTLLYQTAWNFKDQLLNATTIAELEAIDLSQGWPT